MSARRKLKIALVVNTPPGASREPRAEVDFALAALSLDFELEIYFTGDAVLQLAERKVRSAAGLPAGYGAWAALPDLGSVQVFADSAWVGRCERMGIGLSLPVEALGHARMKKNWRRCEQVVVL